MRNDARRRVVVLALASLSATCFAQGQYQAVIMTPEGQRSSGAYTIDRRETGGVAGNAVLWKGSAKNVVDLHPAGALSSSVRGSWRGTQVGFVQVPGFASHAALWKGSAGSFVDLHPVHLGAESSYGWGAHGDQQVGWGHFRTGQQRYSRALLWRGSADSCVILHPIGFEQSEAYGVGGAEQVGVGKLFGGPGQALLWRGSAASVVNLTPLPLYTAGVATCTDGLVQGGWAQEALTGTDHAMIWRGSASSSLDLHPSGYVSSQVHGLSGSLQVGSATTIDGEFEHAIIWSGTAESAHDLHSYLPAGFSHSTAYAVAPDGTVVGVAYDGSFFRHAVMWKPVQ